MREWVGSLLGFDKLCLGRNLVAGAKRKRRVAASGREATAHWTIHHGPPSQENHPAGGFFLIEGYAGMERTRIGFTKGDLWERFATRRSGRARRVTTCLGAL
jgi:hypothetical protein